MSKMKMFMINMPPLSYNCSLGTRIRRTYECMYPGETAEIISTIFDAAKIPLELFYPVRLELLLVESILLPSLLYIVNRIVH